ncbi:uncharacterized protein dok7b isoform X2 [Amia ocellicauda]|uniref:uncharacterized protein dok7b isoform X2 n=1 Tax=Amia ocellicauda TaxID=2972642 RepID=UPI003464B04B
MTDSVVVEGQVKFRDGKKWKSRWVALRKPSPVADCLLMLVYKDKSDKTKGHKERNSITLEDICGLDPGLSYEGVSHTLAIICLTQAVMLGFDNKETMYAWDIRIRYSLGEVHRFNAVVLPGTKLESGPATLHLCNNLLVIVRDLPPAIIGQWKLSDLRRYGAVPNGFVFEGGTRCGYWAGVFFLSCVEGEQISFLFDCIVRGISPTRGPFGLRPVLPDPNANPAYMEDRVSHEALELEKRLSLLSHSSRQSSTASTSSYSTSGALGDDRSLSSSSSDTSHSDTSIGSRLAIWPEPPMSSAPLEPQGLPATKTALQGEEKLYAEVMRGTRPPPKPPRSRKLQEIGRQSSSDSGIATGSHSSYSGSFSSYTGSLDICHGDEFGSLISLPLNFASDQSLCTCQRGEPQRGLGSEYQVPSSLRHLYDTPRSVLQATATRDARSKSPESTLPKDQAALSLPTGITDTKAATPEQSSERRLAKPSSQESSRDSDEIYMDLIPRWCAALPQGQMLESRSSEVAPSAGVSTDPCEICTPPPGISRALFATCPICGGLKCNHSFHPNYITHEQWYTAKKKYCVEGTTLSHSGVLPMPAIPERIKTDHDETVSKKKAECKCGPKSAGKDGDYEDIWNARSVPVMDTVMSNHMCGNLAWERVNKGDEKRPTLGKPKYSDYMCLYSNYCTIGHSNSKTSVQSLYEPMASTQRYISFVKPDVTKEPSVLLVCLNDSDELMYKCKGNENMQSNKVTADGAFTSSSPESNALSEILNTYKAGLQQPTDIPIRSQSTESPLSGETTDKLEMSLMPVAEMDSAEMPSGFQPQEVEDQSQMVSSCRESEEDKKPKKKDEKRKGDLAYEIMEGRGVEKSAEVLDERSSYELMASCGQQKIFYDTEGATSAPGTSGTLKLHREQSIFADPRGSYELMASAVEMPKRCDATPGELGGMLVFPADLPVPDKPRGDGVTYVNIPVSPTSKKQLHYMELELQDPSSGVRGGGSTKYAQIDITATETAHKVGTQHAQFREERLQELEQKKKGALQ